MEDQESDSSLISGPKSVLMEPEMFFFYPDPAPGSIPRPPLVSKFDSNNGNIFCLYSTSSIYLSYTLYIYSSSHWLAKIWRLYLLCHTDKKPYLLQ